MRTAIYLRISSEDEDLRTGEKNESESISNQRSLLRDYVCSHADLSGSEILEFCDDRGFIVDISDEGAVQKRFRLDPEIISSLAFSLGIRY